MCKYLEMFSLMSRKVRVPLGSPGDLLGLSVGRREESLVFSSLFFAQLRVVTLVYGAHETLISKEELSYKISKSTVEMDVGKTHSSGTLRGEIRLYETPDHTLYIHYNFISPFFFNRKKPKE